MIAIDLPGSEPKSCFSDHSLVGPEHKKGDSASIMAGLERDVGGNRQRQRHCPAVLLQGHTETLRSCQGAHLDPRASPPARCSEPGGGRSAARRDGDEGLLVISGAAIGQRLKPRALEIEPLAVARIAPPDDLVDKTTIGVELVKGARAAQQQRISIAFFRWPCELSIAPFSCARPGLLRLGVMR